MKNKKIIVVILFLFTTINLFCLDIKEYDKELVKFLKSEQGNKESLIYSEGVLPPGPQCFIISEDSYIYICDIWNDRIAIFDLDLTYIKEILNKKNKFADNLKIDKNNNIYLNTDGSKISKINSLGTVLYKIYSAQISSDIFKNNNYYPIENFLFFYNKNKKIQVINEEGNVLDNSNSLEKLRVIISTQKNINFVSTEIETTKKYTSDNELIYINEKLLNGDFSVHRKFYNLKKSLYESRAIDNEIEIDFTNYYDYRLIGYDEDNNVYWKAYWEDNNHIKEIILIFSINGNLIDVFYNNLSHSIQVAPNGDLYGMVLGNGGVAFYKITRRW